MPFEHDVFISYPHLSNKDDQSGQNGWVAQFHNDLKSVLDEMLGREARVWRDNKMPFGTVFSKAICERLEKTKVLLCVLSPAYIQSEWCLKELQEFRRLAPNTGGLVINDQSRIVTVIKTPTAKRPDGLSDALFCEFYETSEDKGGAPLPFGQARDGHKYQEYQKRLNQIAWAIKEIVERLGNDPSPDIHNTIYLAETSSDRADDRNKIKNELEARKFIVLPRAPLPKETGAEYIAAVRENLANAFMSIHLFGEKYGLIPDDAQDKSIVKLQNELASERSRQDSLFKRLVWIPTGLGNTDPRQGEFLADLRTNEEALLGAQMLERSFEDLKTRMLQVLTKGQPKRKGDNLVRIYLMCDRRDDESIEPVGRFLYEKGYEVIPPAEAAQKDKVLRYHKNSLLKCDAALTIYGNADFEWVQDRYDDIITKAKGWGRENEISCSAILPTDPETRHKKLLFFRATKVLSPCYNGLSGDALAIPLNEFISELEQVLHA